MLEEAYVKAAMKKTQVYEVHKCFRHDPHCGLEVFFDVQSLLHSEFIPEECTLNKKKYVKILCCLRNAERRKCLEKWASESWSLWHNTIPAYWLLVVKMYEGCP
jgi:hypothetical protein